MMSVEQPSASFRPAALSSGKPNARIGHLPFTADLLAAMKPPLLVQLGVGAGDSYFGLCQIVSEFEVACTCYGIDTWRSEKSNGAAGNGVLETVRRHNNARYRGFSHILKSRFDDALPQFADESVGVLDLDGHFGYELLKNTLQAWMPKLVKNGVVLLHSTALRGGGSGAAKLWEEIHAAHPHFAFRHSEGLGVIGKAKEAEGLPFLATLFGASKEQQESIRRYYFFCAERLEMAAKLGTAGTPEMESSLLRVFWSQAGKYETTPELSQIVGTGGWINLHLELPQGIGDQPLRIDVANRPAVVELAALSLRKAGGHTLWTWNPKDVTDTLLVDGTAVRMPAPDVYRILCVGQASHCYLPDFRGPAFEQPLELEIRMRVDLEMAAVREMIEKWQDLERSKEALEEKLAAGSGSTNQAALEAAITKVKTDSMAQLAQVRVEHELKIKEITEDAEARLEAMKSEFEQQASQQLLHMEEERRQHQPIVIERDRLAAQHPRMLQEIAIAQGNVEELKAEIERLSTEMGTMEFDLTELRKLNARLTAALEEERAARMDMQDSSSWQLTKPFRAVGDLFGSRKKY